MTYIVIGLLGFFAVLVSDGADLRKSPVSGKACRVAGFLLIGYAFVRLFASADRFYAPPSLRIAASVVSGAFFCLLGYSLLVEVPLNNPKGPQEGSRLVRTGTYALVRHPGVLWLLLLHACLVLASGSKPLLAALPFWTGANVLIVALEDRLFFPRLFGDAYREYRRTVPFLLPTWASLRRCLSTFLLPFPEQPRRLEKSRTRGEDRFK